MKIKELADIIYREALQDDPVSILVLGGPGVGKTVLMKEVAQRVAASLGLNFKEYDDSLTFNENEDYVFIPLPLLEMEAPDLTGQMRENGDGTTVYKPPRWVEVIGRCRGFVFIDDITNTRRDDVLSSSFKILNEKMAGFRHFRRDTIIVAAGNRTEDNSVARPLPKPIMAGKVWTLDLSSPPVRDWAAYMDSCTINGKPVPWDRRCLSYLMCFESDIVAPPDDSNDMLNAVASPRSWTKLAQRLASTLAGATQDVVRQGAIGFLGPVIGEKFYAFIRHEIPNPKTMLKNPELFTGLQHDAKYLAVSSVAQHITEAEMSPAEAAASLKKFASTIANESADFVVLLIMSLPKTRGDNAKFREEIAVNLVSVNEDVASAIEGIMNALPRRG
jgi:hypothetical protein